MPDSEQIRAEIIQNAAEIVRLQTRLHETCKLRDRGKVEYRIWTEACAEFRARYNQLAFPGGYSNETPAKVLAGDSYAMEAALCFIEIRPYFHRSGYMFKTLLPKCKRAPFSPEQNVRLQRVLERYAVWQAKKTAARTYPPAS